MSALQIVSHIKIWDACKVKPLKDKKIVFLPTSDGKKKRQKSLPMDLFIFISALYMNDFYHNFSTINEGIHYPHKVQSRITTCK